jgi:hypothetical protein
VDESGMIRTEMGTHNRPEIVAVYGTPFATPPRNSNSRYEIVLLTLQQILIHFNITLQSILVF